MFVIFVLLRRIFLKTARDIKRIEAISKLYYFFHKKIHKKIKSIEKFSIISFFHVFSTKSNVHSHNSNARRLEHNQSFQS